MSALRPVLCPVSAGHPRCSGVQIFYASFPDGIARRPGVASVLFVAAGVHRKRHGIAIFARRIKKNPEEIKAGERRA
ncbi:hypothetical protein AT6N2_C0614 [Agrobacterium tumefaciens]|nr:hypothetical protein AT6N2_C0614 [Agrobacterium tumefaciens]